MKTSKIEFFFSMIALMAIAVVVEAAGPIEKLYDVKIVSPANEYRFATGLNNAGVMTSYDSSGHGFINYGNQVVDLGPNTRTLDVNNRSIICGQKDFLSTVWPKGLWSYQIGPLCDYSVANALNDKNEVAGGMMIPVTDTWEEVFPFVYNSVGALQLLSVNPGMAMAINNSGTAGGNVYRSNPYRSAPVYWQKSRGGYIQQDLPLLSGATGGYVESINDAGELVGSCVMLDGIMHATKWQPTTSGYEAVYLPAPNNGWAIAINNSGQVVGYDDSSARLWQDGQAYDLNLLVPPDENNCLLFAAMAISDKGSILCDGQNSAGYTVEVLLVPR